MIHVVEHAVVADALGRLRRADTGPGQFRIQMTRLAGVLVAAATADLGGETVTVPGVLEPVTVMAVAPPVFVPILRAGAALLDGALSCWPDAPVGFYGVSRDHSTLMPRTYLDALGDITGRDVVVLEPMVATGGSLMAALDAIAAHKPRSVRVVSVVAAPEGVTALGVAHRDVAGYVASVDGRLDDDGYIRPGLGDAGDRAWGPPACTVTSSVHGAEHDEPLPH